VIGVTAVDANGNRAPFSNFGDGVDVAAQGYQIHALWGDDEYIYFNGTSASSPLVAGMAARIIETGQATGPSEVQALIDGEANEAGPPGDDPQYGAGILNAERLESVGQPGIFDIALADLYPATEESDGATFPLYVTFENRGTEFLPEALVEISVNGTPYYYKFSGMDLGEVESVQIPVPEAMLEQENPYTVTAKAKLPERYTDSRPDNDDGDISLTKVPGGG
jgi:subtilisin family serine protease